MEAWAICAEVSGDRILSNQDELEVIHFVLQSMGQREVLVTGVEA
jgi:hypothetical protein